MSAGQPGELHELASRMCDGNLVPAEIERLEEILRADPGARKLYYEFIELHGQLDWAHGQLLAHSERSNPVADVGLSTESLAAAADSQPTSNRPASVGATPVLGFLGPAVNLVTVWLSSPKALALTVVGGLLSYFVIVFISLVLTRVPAVDHNLPSVPPNVALAPTGVARLVGAARCRWQDAASAPEIGAGLTPGTLRLASGVAELAFGAGATVRIEGPAEFAPRSPNYIQLTRGRLVALAPRGAEGFTVGTPRADIVDLGTQFGVQVDQDGALAVEVFRGAVQIVVAQTDGETPIANLSPEAVLKHHVAAGEAARIDDRGTALLASRFTAAEQFVPDLLDADRLRSTGRSIYADLLISQTRPVAYWNFEDGLGRRTQDLIHARQFDSSLLIRPAAGPRPADDFAGMTPTNRALSADGDGALTCDDFTRRFSVGVDAYSLQMWFNSSVAFDKQPVHYLLVRGNGWQSGEDRRDSLLIGGSDKESGVHLSRLLFFPGLDAAKIVEGNTELQPHRWYQMTLVRDGETITVFLDGRQEIHVQSPWLGGEGQYLTIAHRVDYIARLGLHGRFDEVAIWDRALADEEVRKLFENAVRPAAAPIDQQPDSG